MMTCTTNRKAMTRACECEACDQVYMPDMKITTKRWLTKPYRDIRTAKTTITVIGTTFTTAVTIDGHFTRKEAIRRAIETLTIGGQFSQATLHQMTSL